MGIINDYKWVLRGEALVTPNLKWLMQATELLQEGEVYVLTPKGWTLIWQDGAMVDA